MEAVETTGPSTGEPLTGAGLRELDAYWRAANYLTVAWLEGTYS